MKNIVLALALCGCHAVGMRENAASKQRLLINNENWSTVSVSVATDYGSKIYVGRVLSGYKEKLCIPEVIESSSWFSVICEANGEKFETQVSNLTSDQSFEINVAHPIRFSTCVVLTSE